MKIKLEKVQSNLVLNRLDLISLYNLELLFENYHELSTDKKNEQSNVSNSVDLLQTVFLDMKKPTTDSNC